MSAKPARRYPARIYLGWMRGRRRTVPVHWYIGDGIFPAYALCSPADRPIVLVPDAKSVLRTTVPCVRCTAVLAARARNGWQPLADYNGQYR